MIASAIGAGLSAISGITGAVLSAKRANEGQRILDKQHARNQSWYNRQYNSDYIARPEVQSVMNKQREILADAYRRARATNKVAGGTDESLAMLQNSANQSLADTTSSIASSASRYKDSIASERLSEQNAYANALNSTKQAQAQRIAQGASQLSSIGGNIISADDSTLADDVSNWRAMFGLAPKANKKDA